MIQRNKNSFGGRLYAERKKAKLTLSDTAELLGVSAHTIALWEVGEHEPQPSNIKAISSLFGQSPDFLMFGPKHTPAKSSIPKKACRPEASLPTRPIQQTCKLVVMVDEKPSDTNSLPAKPATTRAQEEDDAGTNAATAPAGSYRVHSQAQWPHIYSTLQGAIEFLRRRGGLWYMLEQKVGDEWIVLIDPSASRRPNDMTFIGEDRAQ